MIVVKIYGGLAGQMLQYSIGRVLSKKYNTSLYLDISWFEKNAFQNAQYPREFKLDKLNTYFKVFQPDSLIGKHVFKKYYKGLNPFYLKPVNEKDYSKFDMTILESSNNVILDGYFFSHKYFLSIRDLLMNDLTPKIEMDKENLYYLNKIKNTNSVSVHFRRGDYTLTNFHGVLQDNYYKPAIDYIKNKTVNPQLFIFSDEPEWVAKNIKFDLPFEIININKDEYNFFDVELMRNCKHNIIANSGFSWWAALLNYNDNIVIAPRKWVNAEHSSFDNIPDTWIKL